MHWCNGFGKPGFFRPHIRSFIEGRVNSSYPPPQDRVNAIYRQKQYKTTSNIDITVGLQILWSGPLWGQLTSYFAPVELSALGFSESLYISNTLFLPNFKCEIDGVKYRLLGGYFLSVQGCDGFGKPGFFRPHIRSFIEGRVNLSYPPRIGLSPKSP